ncbi:MAG: hypothetical protein PHP50_09350 [Lachnospiraceae bacterium]|nr:hypothetical protein [Lachnospiraceae bacterium]
MKKTIVGIMMVALIMCAGTATAFAATKNTETNYVDADENGICDNYENGTCTGHKDGNCITAGSHHGSRTGCGNGAQRGHCGNRR